MLREAAQVETCEVHGASPSGSLIRALAVLPRWPRVLASFDARTMTDWSFALKSTSDLPSITENDLLENLSFPFSNKPKLF